jgi:adenylyltransferase/sulfurtransferase
MREDELSDAQLERYARHVILDEVGEAGQLTLLQSRVLVIGAGGLGSPVLLYLAAAGVGTLGIVDHDTVDVTNLQRQIIHTDDDVGEAKVRSAAERIEALNPEVEVIEHRARFTAANAMTLVADYDLVIDGSDNFAARYLINDACYLAKKPLVSAALVRFEGQLSTYKAYDSGPCYRCLFPTPPDPNLVPRCDTVGIFGAVAGVMGTLQAVEALKELLSLGTGMAGRLMLFDALDQNFRTIKTSPDPDCPLCGNSPTITEPQAD